MPRTVCERCSRPVTECYCHLLSSVSNHWAVQILQHQGEASHPFNTARIAALSLVRCSLLPCSDTTDDADLQPAVLAQGVQPVLIYPTATSKPLDTLTLQPGNSLLFIDANWRKSRRLYLQSPWLQSLPAVHLTPTSPSRYRIRKASRPGYLSTLEAIVDVLKAVEPSGKGPAAGSMLSVMDWMIAQQLALRPASD